MTQARKKARWIIPIVVDVAEHNRRTIIRQVVQFVSERTGKVFESLTTDISRVFWSFATASDDCVIHRLQV